MTGHRSILVSITVDRSEQFALAASSGGRMGAGCDVKLGGKKLKIRRQFWVISSPEKSRPDMQLAQNFIFTSWSNHIFGVTWFPAAVLVPIDLIGVSAHWEEQMKTRSPCFTRLATKAHKQHTIEYKNNTLLKLASYMTGAAGSSRWRSSLQCATM